MASSSTVTVVDLGERVGVLRPIGFLGMCTQCHGTAEEISSEVKAVLEAAYPEDQEVGFAVGDFRGFLWAEVAKRNCAQRSGPVR